MAQTNPNNVTIEHLLPADDPAGNGEITAGLLRVLRQAVALRFVLVVLATMLFIGGSVSGRIPEFDASWAPAFFLIEAATFLAFVLWGRSQQALGKWFLPVALGWFLVAPLLEQAIIVKMLPSPVFERIGPGGIAGIGFEALFVVIPVILATWQWGRRGLLASLGVLAVGQAILAPLASSDATDVVIYLVGSTGRLAMIALLGYVVLQLINALRAEHLSLLAANRELARRAATMEQLAESRERNRLARELHDTLAHSLTGLSVQLKALETLLIHDPAAANRQLADAQATVRSGIQESRRAIQALRATPLEDLGLSEALRQLCGKMAERTGLRMHCAIAETGAMDPLVEQAIYRVAETALANIEQHAAAAEAWVSLTVTPDRGVLLEIRDDGVGFAPATVTGDRFGLAGMAERAALIGAVFGVEARPGQGTQVTLEVQT